MPASQEAQIEAPADEVYDPDSQNSQYLDDDDEDLSDQETEEPEEPPNLREILLSMGSDGDENNDMPE